MHRDDDTIEIHGRRVAFRRLGEGPPVLLIHGIAGTNATWERVAPALARTCTVIAPDLPGHGASGVPAGDHSVGAMAAILRDLLLALGHERATLVGHSLGGGVAMQFAYLFPEQAERLVLISSGGLGRTVNPVLRSATLPGAELVTTGIGLAAGAAGRLLRPALGLARIDVDSSLAEVGNSLVSLGRRETRAAFHATLRASVGFGGQRVFAGDRLYLAEAMPTLIVWGSSDPIIPVGHGRRAHAAMPGSRFVVLEGVGHFPPLERPSQVTAEIVRFLADTEPADPDPSRFRDLLRRGGEASDTEAIS